MNVVKEMNRFVLGWAAMPPERAEQLLLSYKRTWHSFKRCVSTERIDDHLH